MLQVDAARHAHFAAGQCTVRCSLVCEECCTIRYASSWQAGFLLIVAYSVTVCCNNIALCSNCWVDTERTCMPKVTAMASCYLHTKNNWISLVVGTQNTIAWHAGGAYHNVPNVNCVQRPDSACHQTHTYMSAVIAQAVALGIFFYWHIILLKFGVKDAQQMPYRSFRCCHCALLLHRSSTLTLTLALLIEKC